MSAITIIGSLALLGFDVWLLYGARDLTRLGLSSYKWASTEDTIVDSHDQSFTTAGLDSTGTGIVLVEDTEAAHGHVHQLGGQTYQSSRFCFGGAENATAAYLIGTKVPVYYHPKSPDVAVLRRGIQFGAVFGIVPIGAAILWLFLSLRRQHGGGHHIFWSVLDRRHSGHRR